MIDQIVADVRQQLARRKQQKPLKELVRLVDNYGAPRDFEGAVRGEGIKLIAEIKRASPSKGWLCPDLDVAALARSYARGGAAAISVLTEPTFFKGSFVDLATARQVTHLPLLCKDFILDPYQLYEARAFGADAILLITALLSLSELRALIEIAQGLGMAALVEVHSESEVKRALEAKANPIGINNRHLADFGVDLGTTLRLRPLIPSDVTVVSESGIKSYADVIALKNAGVNAVLVGEALVTSPDPEAKIRELKGEHRVGQQDSSSRSICSRLP
jgi:indole-3-glycerol phosphate synthase